MKTILIQFVFGLLMSLLAWPALGFNLNFLKDTPVAQFRGNDARLFQEALRDTLDRAADGETRSWSNPATGSSGKLTPELTRKRKDTVCRQVRIANTAGGISQEGAYMLCRRADGTWGLAQPTK